MYKNIRTEYGDGGRGGAWTETDGRSQQLHKHWVARQVDPRTRGKKSCLVGIFADPSKFIHHQASERSGRSVSRLEQERLGLGRPLDGARPCQIEFIFKLVPGLFPTNEERRERKKSLKSEMKKCPKPSRKLASFHHNNTGRNPQIKRGWLARP